MESIIQLIIDCNGSINNIAGVDIVRKTSSNTTTNAELCTMINQIMGNKLTQKINLHPLCKGNISAMYPSFNACLDASTDVPHTENDQGFTMIVVPEQHSVNRPFFEFQLSNLILQTYMSNRIIIYFNARLLAHHRILNRQKHKQTRSEFWNIGCYANRKFEQHSYTLMVRIFEDVLNLLEQYL